MSSRTDRPVRRTRPTAAAIALACAAALPTAARAASFSWNTSVASGNWNVAANWVPAAVPGGAADVSLNQSDATHRTVTYVHPGGTAVTLATLQISATGPGTMTLAHAQDLLDVGSFTIGSAPASTGTVNHTGGTTTAATHLTLGGAAGAGGVYTLGGNARLTVGGDLRAGSQGAWGTFTQSGGTNTVGGAVLVGSTNAGALPSAYTLSAGSLATGTVRVAAGSSFILSGGRLANGTNGVVVENAGAFNVSGGSFDGKLINSGAATLNLGNVSFESYRGFVHNSSVPVNVGPNSGLRAYYSGMQIWGQMTSSGTVVASSMEIGQFAATPGQYTQNAGVVAGSGSASQLNILKGSYTLNAGLLSFPTLGVYDTFTQAGGTVNANLLYVTNPASKYVQTAGTLTITPQPNTVPFDTQVSYGSLNLAGTVNWGASARVNISGGTTTLAGTQTWHPTSQLNVSGGTVNLSSDASGASLTLTGGNLAFGSSQHLASFSATSGGSAVINSAVPYAPRVLVTRAFTMGGSAKLDIRNNALVLDFTNAPGSSSATTAALASVRAAIASGYNATAAAHWTGPGLVSAHAAADPSTAVGYALASAALNLSGTQTATFLGQTVDASSVLVRLTKTGDATLDGTVDFNDLVKLAQNYNTTLNNPADSTWSNGDFTYDGTVDFNDLVKLAQNYNTTLQPAAAIPGAPLSFQHDLARAFATVPEPTALPLLAPAACGLAARRRRHRR